MKLIDADTLMIMLNEMAIMAKNEERKKTIESIMDVVERLEGVKDGNE